MTANMGRDAEEANNRGESYQPARPQRYRAHTVEAIRWDGTDEGYAAARVFTGSPVPMLSEPEYQGVVIDTNSIAHLWDYDQGGYYLPSGLHIDAPFRVRCLVLLPIASNVGPTWAVPGDYIVRDREGAYSAVKGAIFEQTHEAI